MASRRLVRLPNPHRERDNAGMPDAINPTLALLHRHRSIRRFTEEVVSDDDMTHAVAAAQMASTSSAVQAYCLIRVNDDAKRKRLVALTGDQIKVARCGAFLVVCGDTRRHRLVAERSGQPHHQNLESFMIATIDASLFAQNLAVAFESLGLGICYIGGLRNHPREVDELLGIPFGVFPLFGMCVGRPAEGPTARPRLPIDAVLFEESYPDDRTMLAALDRYDAHYVEYLKERDAKATPWSTRVAERFDHLEREELAVYYASKGASLT
jgi:FMN reductase (NADPH)